MRKLKYRSPWFFATLGLLLTGLRAVGNDIYTASFQTPIIQINKPALVAYQVNLTVASTSIYGLSITLCQTKDKTLPDGSNSWRVLDLLSGVCVSTRISADEYCKNHPYQGRQYIETIFKPKLDFNQTGEDSLDYFFFCVASQNNQYSLTCDYISDRFNISLDDADAKPVSLDSSQDLISTLLPTIYPNATPVSIPITASRSIFQSPTPSSTSTSPTTTSVPLVSSQKKGLSTASEIGIGFGVFSLFLLLGLVGLIILRRSSARKRAQAAHSFNVDSFKNSNLKAEKDNQSPISPPSWITRRSQLHRAQDRGDISELAAPVPVKLTSHPISTSQIASENGFHLRDLSRRKSNMRRNSIGSVSISPIPSLRSETLYEHYQNDEAQNTKRMSRDFGMSSTAPFLREEGMSLEEIARLEDEERRIDAAIAAAEAQRVKGRR